MRLECGNVSWVIIVTDFFFFFYLLCCCIDRRQNSWKHSAIVFSINEMELCDFVVIVRLKSPVLYRSQPYISSLVFFCSFRRGTCELAELAVRWRRQWDGSEHITVSHYTKDWLLHKKRDRGETRANTLERVRGFSVLCDETKDPYAKLCNRITLLSRRPFSY